MEANLFKRMEEDVTIQLFQAVDNNDLNGILSCIEEGVDLDSKDANGQTALTTASEKGYLDIVNELLSHNVDVNARDDDGWTALIAASKEGHMEIVLLLLENGAKLNIADLGGWTPLTWASYKGKSEIIKKLLFYGANPNERGQHNMTALIWAAGRGHVEVVDELIKGGAKPEVADKYGTTALIWASRKGYYEVAEKLIYEGANCNAAGTHGWTPLIMAAKGGYQDVVMLLLDENTNLNAVDQDGKSALSWAAKEGFNEIVSKLLQKGAFLNMPDRYGDSPLMLAASEGHADVVHTLLNAYADIEMTQAEGKTALFVAVEKGHVAVVNELLLAGANTEAANKEGEVALLVGGRKKHTHCVKLLLEKGVNTLVTDKKGDTVLHIAVRNKFSGMCEVLLKDAKNSRLLHRSNKAGETPYSIDAQNKPPILSSMLTGNQISPNEFDKMHGSAQQNLLTSTFAEFLVEPSLTIPLTVGIYSRWGTGKSTYLQRIMDFLQDFRDQEPVLTFTITMPTVIFCIIIAITTGLIIWPITSSWPAGIATALCITVLLLLLLSIARIALVSPYDRIHWLGAVLTNFLNRFYWFLRLVYCIPPSVEDIRHMLPVHLIIVDLTRSVAVGDNPMTSLVNFSRAINNAIENDIGTVIPRIYRVFQAGPYRAKINNLQKMKMKWKTSCCCIPSFLITVIIVISLCIGVFLFGKYGLTGPGEVIGIQIVCCCICGISLILNILRVCVMIYCLALPMKKRVKIVSSQTGIQEDTFLTVLKQELEIFIDMLECMDGFAKRQTRVVIKLDLLDSLEQQKVLSLINAINLLVTEPGHPFILVLSVDPRLLIKAVDQALATMPGPIIQPRDYLRNLIDLPFYVNEQSKTSYDGVVPVEIRTQFEEQQSLELQNEELDWDSNGELLSSRENEIGDSNLSNGNAHPLKPGRSVKFPSNESLKSGASLNITEEISNLLRNNENGTLSDVKRVMNIVSLKGRVLRNSQVGFKWTSLAIWVSLCDGWPYKASWITILCLDSSLELPPKMLVKNLYFMLGYSMPGINDQDTNSENSPTYFDTFLSTHKPMLTVRDVRTFAPLVFYVDHTIRRLMVDYLLSAKSGSLSRQTSFKQALSSRSNIPLSPGSSKFIWRAAIDDVYLGRMTIDDVANQLVDIDGVDETLLPVYKTRIHDNNINGRVLVTCDLNELREAMQMKFGDWQLFKAWILSCRNKETTLSRNGDKASSYRSSSRNMSYGEGSQTESIPDSPKITYSQIQKMNRLPALTESGNGTPYNRHSPRSTPQQNRKIHKHKRPTSKNEKSFSQDSESSPLKGEQVNSKWQRSADSGFVSSDVDPHTKRLLAMRQTSSASDNERMMPTEQHAKIIEMIESSPREQNEASTPIKCSDSFSAQNFYGDTWNAKTGLGLGNIHKVGDVLSSGSSEYVAIDIDDKKTWKFAKISDTDENVSENGNEDCDMNSISGERPLSLSDVPLPPISMLNDSSELTVTPPIAYADHDPTLPQSSVKRKKAFKNKQLRGMSNYMGTSEESEKLLTDDGSTKSEPNVTIIRASKFSLQKSNSNEYTRNEYTRRKTRSNENNLNGDGLLWQTESQF